MAILKSKEIMKMSMNELEGKLKDLNSDLIKARVAGKKIGKGPREIRRTIAKILTIKKIKESINNKGGNK